MIRPFGKPVAPWDDTQGPGQTRGALNQLAKAISGSITPKVTTAVVPVVQVIKGSGTAFVAGDDGSGNAFVDQVVWNAAGGVATVLHSTTVDGAPAVRAYTVVAGALSLAMASGTYAVTVAPLILFTDTV